MEKGCTMNISIAISVILASSILVIYLILRTRNIDIWFMAYIKERIKKLTNPGRNNIKHIYFCFADHYEPFWRQANDEEAMQRVDQWIQHYPKAVEGHYDSEGKKPIHTMFYPEEEYTFEIIDKLNGLVKAGIADIEIHLHHDDDTAENLEKTLMNFKKVLHEEHGLLRKNEQQEIIYAFIHGNWSLDNSRPDGRYCGVDNELSILKKTGCYIDMTMPSAPSDTQTKIINSIYQSKGIEGQCKSHDNGELIEVNTRFDNDSLLLLQGPLTLNWKNRKFGLIPKVESSEISSDARPTDVRINLWENCNVCVKGQEDHVFIKLHTHGAEDGNIKMFFEDGEYDSLLTKLERKYRDNDRYKLHYMSAWDMYQKIVELNAGT